MELVALISLLIEVGTDFTNFECAPDLLMKSLQDMVMIYYRKFLYRQYKSQQMKIVHRYQIQLDICKAFSSNYIIAYIFKCEGQEEKIKANQHELLRQIRLRQGKMYKIADLEILRY